MPYSSFTDSGSAPALLQPMCRSFPGCSTSSQRKRPSKRPRAPAFGVVEKSKERACTSIQHWWAHCWGSGSSSNLSRFREILICLLYLERPHGFGWHRGQDLRDCLFWGATCLPCFSMPGFQLQLFGNRLADTRPRQPQFWLGPPSSRKESVPG